jgi:hypothetical protein
LASQLLERSLPFEAFSEVGRVPIVIPLGSLFWLLVVGFWLLDKSREYFKKYLQNHIPPRFLIVTKIASGRHRREVIL